MKYADIRQYDVANGEGIRTVLFVSGCTHNCKGCFNALYQDFNYGKEFGQSEIDLIINYVSKKEVRGLTLLGGEPMQNIDGVKALLEQLYEHIIKWRSSGIEKDIWMYSGYTFEELYNDSEKRELLKYIDVLIDGRFVEEELDLRLAFRGSRNQRIICVQKSLEKGFAVEIEKYKT